MRILAVFQGKLSQCQDNLRTFELMTMKLGTQMEFPLYVGSEYRGPGAIYFITSKINRNSESRLRHREITLIIMKLLSV